VSALHGVVDVQLTRCSNNEIITSTSDFQTFWENLAGKFKDNNKVIFDTSKSSAYKPIRSMSILTPQTTSTTPWTRNWF
jgi:hypothetical protein